MVDLLVKIEGFIDGLVKLVKDLICFFLIKVLLVVLYYMIIFSERIIVKILEMDLVFLFLYILVDVDKNICEKVLGVLDGICCDKVGIEVVYNNVLIVLVVVKKILRVFDMVIEFLVFVLWRLSEKEGVVVEVF